jgi:hypothetical protein
MTNGFQQQGKFGGFAMPKPAPAQQHGEKSAKPIAPGGKKPRSFEPRPGH